MMNVVINDIVNVDSDNGADDYDDNGDSDNNDDDVHRGTDLPRG